MIKKVIRWLLILALLLSAMVLVYFHTEVGSWYDWVDTRVNAWLDGTDTPTEQNTDSGESTVVADLAECQKKFDKMSEELVDCRDDNATRLKDLASKQAELEACRTENVESAGKITELEAKLAKKSTEKPVVAPTQKHEYVYTPKPRGGHRYVYRPVPRK